MLKFHWGTPRILNGGHRITKPLLHLCRHLGVFIRSVSGLAGISYFLLRQEFNRGRKYRLKLKDSLVKLVGKGIYKIPCDYGKLYIGETGWSVRTKNHGARKINPLNILVVLHHFIITYHKMAVFERTFFLAQEIRDVIENKKTHNFNRDLVYGLLHQ